jgi:hypothetical protein
MAPASDAVTSLNGWTLEKCLQTAEKLSAAGKLEEAMEMFSNAWTIGSWTTNAEPLLRAAAGLGFAHMALTQGSWPLLSGMELDELLLAALELARLAGKKKRSRAMEGQLLLFRSQALFQKPSKDVSSIDAAVDARRDAVELLAEAQVESLPWPVAKIEKALEALSGSEAGAALNLDQLLSELSKLWPTTITEEVSDTVSTIFEAWASASQRLAISLSDFLKRCLEILKSDIAFQALPENSAHTCSTHVPCEGGLPAEGYSDLERELVKLVSRDGAADGDWELKAAELHRLRFEVSSGEELRNMWLSLAPQIKEFMKNDQEQACGHSCSTCPTRSTCQVHTVLESLDW